jgi:hypothetical protein
MRLLIKGLFIVFIATAFVLMLLPSLLSIDWGRKQMLAIMNHLIPGELEIRRLQLQWGNGQVIEGFLLKDPEGNSVLSIEKLSSETPLWKLLNRGTQIGMTHIHNLNASITANHLEWMNFNRALGLDIREASSPTVFEINNFDAKMELPSNSKPFTASMKGEVQYGSTKGSVLIDVLLDSFKASNWHEVMAQMGEYLSQGEHQNDKIELRLVDFFPLLIDELLTFSNPRLKGVFHAFFGERLNLNLQKPSLGSGLTCSITAPQIEGLLKVSVDNRQLIVHGPSTLQLLLTPELVNSFTPKRTELLKEAPLKLTIAHFSIPLAAIGNSSSPHNFVSWGFNIDAELASTDLNLNPLGLINIGHFNAHLDSSAGDPFMNVEVVGHAEHYQQPIDINYARRLNKPATINLNR